MNPTNNPEDKINYIAEQLGRHAHRCYRIKLLFKFLVLALIICLCISIINQCKGIYLFPLFFYPAVIFIFLLTGFIISSFHKPDKKALLIKAERNLNLKEQLSTAYEYRNNNKNPFYIKLLYKAAASVEKIIPHKILEPALTLKNIFILPLAAIIILFSVINVDIDILAIIQNPYDTYELGKIIEEYSTAFDKETHPSVSPGLSEFIDDLEVLGMELQTKRLRKEELENILQKLGLEVKENMEQILSELESKEYSPSDLALIRLLSYFASDTFQAKKFRETLDSIKAAYNEEEKNNKTAFGETAEMDLNKKENPDKGNITQPTGDSKKLEFYPDYMNTLHSLQNQWGEKEQEETIVNMDDDRVVRGDTHKKDHTDGGEESSLSEIKEPTDESGVMGENTGVPDNGNQVENSNGEAGTGSPTMREESVMTGLDENDQEENIIIKGMGDKGKILELIKELTGEESNITGEEVPDVYTQEYQKAVEEAVSEGEIPREYSEFVKQYFLYIGLVLTNEVEEE